MGSKILTIEIMINQIKVCVISNNQNIPKVYQTMIFDTPEDCVEDGYIKDIKTLSELMAEKLRGANITVTRTIFTITSSKIVTREVVIPYVNKAKIQEIIKLNSSEYFPMDISDYNITHMILERRKTKEEKFLRLLLLAAHNNLLSTYFELARSLNLQLESIDYVGNSAYQLFKKQSLDDVCLSILINEQSTLINVINRGSLVLQRTIPYGYNVVQEAVLANSDYRVTDLNSAYGLLVAKGILNPQFGDIDDLGDVSDVSDVEDEIAAASINKVHTSNKWYYKPDFREKITDSLQYLISNIIRVADYYISRNPEVRIQKAYICGFGAKLKGIDVLFSRESGMEVQIIDKLKYINFIPFAVPDGLVPSDFVSNIGAILQPVGMLPKEYSDRAEKKSDIKVVAAIASLAVITSIALSAISILEVKEAKEEQVKLNNEVATLQSVELVYAENDKLKADQTKIDSIDIINSNSNENLRTLIEELETKLPSSTNIYSLRSSKTDFIMDVSVDSKETAATLLLQLKSIDALENVKTSSIAEEVNELGMVSVKLSITASYKGANIPIVEEVVVENTEEVQGDE